MPPIPRELPADVRTAAASIRNLYLAFINEEFTEQQALYILGVMLAAAAGKDSQ